MSRMEPDNTTAACLDVAGEVSVPPQLDGLSQIIEAYNQVTDNLQRSHDALRREVLRLQEQLASTDAQLQRSRRLAALGEMAAGIAHEIRNPLAAIHLYARMLVEDLPADSDTQRTASRIASAVRGLDAVVTDVLTFAREMQPRPRELEATAMLERAVEAHRPAIAQQHVTVRIDADEDLIVAADPELMQQALLNLVRNAVDAMACTDGDVDRVLTLAARLDQGRIVLTVRDNGPGIDEDKIDRIFNPFFTTRSTGTGLGLAIVHRIVDAHSGAISVHNDSGAVFELLLPVRALGPRDEACGILREWSQAGVHV